MSSYRAARALQGSTQRTNRSFYPSPTTQSFVRTSTVATNLTERQLNCDIRRHPRSRKIIPPVIVLRDIHQARFLPTVFNRAATVRFVHVNTGPVRKGRRRER